MKNHRGVTGKEMKSHEHDSITIFKTTKEELRKLKALKESKEGDIITWDEFLLALIKHDKDLGEFM